MAACRIVDQGMTTAEEALAQIQTELETAGNDFINSFNNAIAEMEGEMKDALSDYIKNEVQPFVTEGVPNAIGGMVQLLKENHDNFIKVDADLANSLKGNN